MILRVVLDTNVLVSGIGWSGPSARIIDSVVVGRCTLVCSRLLLDELQRVLKYPKLAAVFPDPDATVRLVADMAEISYPDRSVQAVADEDDNRVLEAAVAAAADYIVTGNADLLALRNVEGIGIVAPAEFASLLGTE